MAGVSLNGVRQCGNGVIGGNFVDFEGIILLGLWPILIAGDTSSRRVEKHAEFAEGACTLRGVGKALRPCQLSEQILRGKPLDDGHRAATKGTRPCRWCFCRAGGSRSGTWIRGQ
jgi:hypothetical protein